MRPWLDTAEKKLSELAEDGMALALRYIGQRTSEQGQDALVQRIQSLETELGQAHTQLQEAHPRIQSLETELGQAHAQLQEAHQRIQSLETELGQVHAQLQEAQTQAAQTQKSYDALKKYTAGLELTVRELQMGLRRHVSEGITQEQLALALASPATPEPPSAEPKPSEEAPADAEPKPDAGTPPAAPPKPPRKRDRHGRRTFEVLARVPLEILPPEVLVEGLQNFTCIGVEESSMLAYRRPALVEVLLRRPKFVPCNRRCDGTPSQPQAPADPVQTPKDVQASEAHKDNGDTPKASVVQAHASFVAPKFPDVPHHPFVDGALVRYVPVSPKAPSSTPLPRVLMAPPWARPIESGMADASLLAHLLVQKYDYHVPYYRQEKEFERLGLSLSRTNMVRWQFEVGELLVRLRDAMWKDALTQAWVATDGTGTAVRDKEKCRLAHVFVLISLAGAILFRSTTKYDHPTMLELFGGYRGKMVLDASANHNILFGPGKATECGCWAHGRRPLVSGFRAGEGAAVAEALQMIAQLFLIEREGAQLDPEARLKLRQQKSAPIVEAFFAWVDRHVDTAPVGSFLRKAAVYARNQREALCEFLRDGAIPLSNNVSERELRRIVKGRLNWLFHGTEEHLDRACAILSLIASCEPCGLDPELYLQEILTVLPSYPDRQLLDLSPERWGVTRQRLLAEGSLQYLDLRTLTGSTLTFRTH